MKGRACPRPQRVFLVESVAFRDLQVLIQLLREAGIDAEPRPIEGYEDSIQRRRQYEIWFGDDVEP